MSSVEDVAGRCDRILTEVERAVVGKRQALELVLLAFLADGHVLLEDFPGLAKTLIARSFAQVCDMQFSRIQFTPDLMPSDVTGSSRYNQRTPDFESPRDARRHEARTRARGAAEPRLRHAGGCQGRRRARARAPADAAAGALGA